MNIDELLSQIEKRPDFFLPGRNIRYLSSFLDGYFFCETLNQIDGCNPISSTDKSYDQFRVWIIDKYKLEHNVSIERALNYFCKNELQAFNSFFELWKEFKTSSRIKA